ncbi:MAG: MMPL family transporter [Gaiellales bacterium]
MSSHTDSHSLDEEQRIAHSGALARFIGHCAHHPWRVIATWFATVVVLIGLNVAFHGTLQNNFRVPGTDFQKATDLITAKFPKQKGDFLRVVVAAPAGETLTTTEHQDVIERMLKIGLASEHTIDTKPGDASTISDPLAPKSQSLSKSGRIAFFDVQFDKQGFELPRSKIVDLENQLRAAGEQAGLQVEFTGGAENPPPQQGLSDIIGLVVAFFILMVLFRALVPTAIPLLFAITAVASAFLLLYLAARITDFNTITEILVPMIGLGVGIDYTLFIVTRFRQFLHDGLEPRDAAAAAGATAGRAVIFAGLTVAISITGLAFIGIDFITKLGVGSALGVLTAVLLANSLLPAVLALLGHKIDRGRLGLKPTDDSREGQQKTPIAAWGRFVTRNAKIVLPIAVILLVLGALPVLAVRLGLADEGTAPKGQTTRKAYDLLSSKDGFGPGFTAPIPVVVDIQNDHQAPTRLEAAMRAVPGIAQVDKPIYNAKTPDKASVAIINAYSRYAPQDAKTDDVVSTLRNTTIPKVLAGSKARAYVSGQNAAFTDIGNKILDNSPKFLLYIIGVTFLVLAMAFRSLVVAIKAALATLTSALVGFGMLVLIVQLGHGMNLVGLDRTGPIESFIPPIAFAILFGLSMDYEVFLMSRIREEHVHGSDTLKSVRDGVAGVGRVILAAALIMSSVFFSFLLNPDRVSKEFALFLGIAILTDALIIRLTLIPALLALLGDKTWFIPRWLDRALPNVTIEPPASREPAAAPEPASAPA